MKSYTWRLPASLILLVVAAVSAREGISGVLSNYEEAKELEEISRRVDPVIANRRREFAESRHTGIPVVIGPHVNPKVLEANSVEIATYSPLVSYILLGIATLSLYVGIRLLLESRAFAAKIAGRDEGAT